MGRRGPRATRGLSGKEQPRLVVSLLGQPGGRGYFRFGDGIEPFVQGSGHLRPGETIEIITAGAGGVRELTDGHINRATVAARYPQFRA